MKKILIKVLVVLLAMILLLPTVATTVMAARVSGDTYTFSSEEQENTTNTYTVGAEIEEAIQLLKSQQEKKNTVKQFVNVFANKNNNNDDLKKDYFKAVAENVGDLKDNLEAAESSWDYIKAILSMVSGVVACLGPYGAMAAAAINIIMAVVDLFLGGEEPTSEIAQMEDRLSQQFDQVKEQLSGIEEQIEDLSNQINEMANTIIREVKAAVDTAEAKSRVENFLSSGEGNFSFNHYRNYLYGSATNNDRASTAYYALLKQSIINGESDETIKSYYDLLYASLMEDRDPFYEYILGTDVGKSIVQYYYDVLKANPDIAKENGTTSEVMALMFAYDVYTTATMADDAMASCNIYQYTQILLAESAGQENATRYVYDPYSPKGFVTKDQIIGGEGIDSLDKERELRRAAIEAQMAEDLAYIFGSSDSFVVATQDGRVYEVENNDPETFGRVTAGQTIYLNQIPEEICDFFGIEAGEFTYEVTSTEIADGIFYVDSNLSQITATLCYKGEAVNKIEFVVGTDGKFQGGSGTVSDPYLISTAEQFCSIAEGLDKHYRLINDIDLGGQLEVPIGQRINSNNQYVYDEFDGSLDGNGYKVSNTEIIGYDYSGLFGIIGEGGRVTNLTVYNFVVKAKVERAEYETSNYYAGIIAGKNIGIIEYCKVDSDLVKEENKETNKGLEVREYSIPMLLKKDLPDYLREYLNRQLISGKTDVRQLNSLYTAELSEYTKTVIVPDYGVTMEVENLHQSNRNINVYTGGIAGCNANVISKCSVENNKIYAYSRHDFGGDITDANKNHVYAGGFCGQNYGAVEYSLAKETAVIIAKAHSSNDPKGEYRPVVQAHAGVAIGDERTEEYTKEIRAETTIYTCSNVYKCESNYIQNKSQCKSLYNEYFPNEATVDIEEIISEKNRKPEIVLDFGAKHAGGVYYDCLYQAGDAYAAQFDLVEVKTEANVTTRRYRCVELGGELELLSDGSGKITVKNVEVSFTYKEKSTGELEIIENDGQADLAMFNISSLRFAKKHAETAESAAASNIVKANISGLEKRFLLVETIENAELGTTTRVFEHEEYKISLSSDGIGTVVYNGATIDFKYKTTSNGVLEIIKIDETDLIEPSESLEEIGISDIWFEIECVDVELNTLRVDDLVVYVDGVESEYEILEVYGFNTVNESFSDVEIEVTFLLGVNICGKYTYVIKPVTMVVEKNRITSIEFLGAKEKYVLGTHSWLGCQIKVNYAVGDPGYITVTEERLSSGEIKIYDSTLSSFGEKLVQVEYLEKTVAFTVMIYCGHGSNFTKAESGYSHNAQMSVAPTCSEIGYDYYECDECGDVKLFYKRKLEHTPDYDSIEKPSCTDESVIGKVDCAVCKAVLAEGVLVPKQAHDYIYFNENLHRCDNGEHFEAHHYSVSEEVRLLDNKNGTQSWYIVYTYTCVCKKDGKAFTKEVVDENEITEEERELPMVAVSNGYVLNGGDLVVVYVQLINNPGVKAVNFGIRYSDGLELVGTPQNGDLFKGSMVSESGAVDYGYNFVFAGSELVTGDGNLLKLAFKVTEAAKLGDVYDVSVVYSMGVSEENVQIEGGFYNGTRINVVTRDGYIKVVEDLPGDVNDDGAVDLMDAVLLAKFYVNSGEYPLETKEADLNLDKAITPDDIVALLEYIVGGYGTNLMTQDFEIVLNTNGYDQILKDISVSIYGENDTYVEAGLGELKRPGYKFLGWFDRISGGNKVTPEDAVKYNPNQKKQMLYAQWELNALVFNGNGATDGHIDNVYFAGDNSLVLDENAYKREYDIAFISDKAGARGSTGLIKYKLVHWLGSNGKTYSSLAQAVRDLNGENYGELVLVAIWTEEPTINFPEMAIDGYEKEVEWYGDDGFNIVTKIDKNSDIFKYEQINGYYMAYAKHDPIVYDIVVDFNGGSGVIGDVSSAEEQSYISDRSVEKTYSLTNITATNAGRTLTGWKIYVDDAFVGNCSAGATLGYIKEAKQDSKVEIVALWDAKLYTITYNLNGGMVQQNGAGNIGKISELDASMLPTVYFEKYTVDTLDDHKMLEPIYKEYYRHQKFLGWYVDKELTQPFDKEVVKADPKNISLYAKWDLCDTYNHVIDQGKVSGKRVIIDWSEDKDGTANSNSEIMIEGATEIYIYGHSEVYYNNVIFIVNSSESVYLQLNDFKADSRFVCADLSNKFDIVLDCVGECILATPESTPAFSGFNGLIVDSVNSESEITGENSLRIRLKTFGNADARATSEGMKVETNGALRKYSINVEMETTNEWREDTNNKFEIKAWYVNGTFAVKSTAYSESGVESLANNYSSEWYAPLFIEKIKEKNDLIDIGEVESIYVYVGGGSGNYDFEPVVNGEGAGAEFRKEQSQLAVFKEDHSKSGTVILIIKDKDSKQTITYTRSWSTAGCFTGDTLVTLADGSVARLDSLKQGDIVLSWNPIEGRFEPMPISLIWNHGDSWYNVLKLNFSNGKTVSVVETHGFFDSTLNEYVFINSINYNEFIGHKFACMDANGAFEDVTLDSVDVSFEFTSCYSLRSACNDNVIVNGFMTLTIEDVPGMLTYFEFGEDYMYDKEKMEADIETYGLYTYEEWKDYVSYEEFVALNGQYFKILVGKGYLTIDDIFVLIAGMR